MPNFEQNPNFLKQKYNLHNTPEVKSAAERTEVRNGEKISQKPSEQIQNYLNRFQEILDREDEGNRETGINALKKVLRDKFVTKYEDIPQNWHDLNERILRERGQAGDWNNYSKEDKEKTRRMQAEAVLADQDASLEQWVDYLASPDSSYMPDYIKYFVFRNITELSEYDKDKQEFPKRSKGTVKMFPDINQEALAYVIDAILKKQDGKEFKFDNFEADLSDEQKEQFKNSLNNENFAKLYAWANEQIHPIAKHLLPITEGKWVKYEQDDEESENYKELNKSIRGRGTGWCTAGENTAKTQLQSGDFYCYYTLDDNKEASIPRIAIRMENDKIAEVRGISYKQNLDPYMGDVLNKKLEEFPDKDEYLKKESNMKMLTEIENKTKKQEELNREELRFLFEMDDQIDGFGYQKDPRIKELREARNLQKDLPIIFSCQPEQIATTKEEATENKNIKVYVGPFFKELIERDDIEYIYTKFSEQRIEKFNMTIGERSKDQIQTELNERAKILDYNNPKQITNYAQWMLDHQDFKISKEKKNIKLVKLSVTDLGFPNGATFKEIIDKGKEMGLDICPPEVGPLLRLDYEKLMGHDLPKNEWVAVAMNTINDSYGNPHVFFVDRYGDGKRYLRYYWAYSDSHFDSDDAFLFARK